MDLGDI
jgi:hypothetical protein